MAWVALNDDERERVRTQLPDIVTLQKMIINELHRGVIAIWYSHNMHSTIPQASVCLRDAADVLMQIRHALTELLSFQIWYLERKKPPNKGTAEYLAKFYADDIALRLYTVVEHLGNSINLMLEVDKRALKQSYNKSEIGKNTLAYLLDQHSGSKITAIWSKLLSSREWNAVRKYRNNWVHSKPPIVKTQGDQFNRDKRWQEIGSGVWDLVLKPGGDKHAWIIDDLVKVITRSVFLVFHTTEDIVAFYLEKIEPFRKNSFLTIETVERQVEDNK